MSFWSILAIYKLLWWYSVSHNSMFPSSQFAGTKDWWNSKCDHGSLGDDFLRLGMLPPSVTTLYGALIRCHHPLPCCCHQCPSISILTENPLLKSWLCPTMPAVWPRQHGWVKLNVRGDLPPHSLPYWPLLILLTNLWGCCSCLGLTAKNSGTSGRFFFRITWLMKRKCWIRPKHASF